MPKKGRPLPLPDGIFQPRDPEVSEGVPVRNTFIQFGVPGAPEKTLSTAPAWIGPSLQSLVQSATRSAMEVSEGKGEPTCLEELPSPRKVSMTLTLSASSALTGLTGAFASFDGPHGERDSLPDTEQRPEPVKAQIEEREPSEKEEEDEEEDDSGDDDGSEDETIVAMVAAGELPSLGSAKHLEGQCKRCCFFPKGRCLNGYSCEFCHFEHEKRKRKKKKKGSKRAASEVLPLTVDGPPPPPTAPPMLPPMALRGATWPDVPDPLVPVYPYYDAGQVEPWPGYGQYGQVLPLTSHIGAPLRPPSETMGFSSGQAVDVRSLPPPR
mmetsp:Transcript_9005/g.25132  ORF Transcript_9005/g.25132 Transcript_9005/m.25132 type:complete len:324 (-) Transcript_9005:211-1182(-)